MISKIREAVDADVKALFGIVDFFIPLDVFLAIFLVFAMENIVEQLVGDVGIEAWLLLYGAGVAVLAISTYLGADDDELEDLHSDLDELD